MGLLDYPPENLPAPLSLALIIETIANFPPLLERITLERGKHVH